MFLTMCWEYGYVRVLSLTEAHVCALYSTMSCPSGGRLSTSPRSICAFCTACILVLMVPIKACCAELYTYRRINGFISHRMQPRLFLKKPCCVKTFLPFVKLIIGRAGTGMRRGEICERMTIHLPTQNRLI